MPRDLSSELQQLRTERQQLLAALGRQVADRPWPGLGDVVTINCRWDGPSLFDQDDFLILSEGDEVRVDHVNPQGWLWGTVDTTGQSGWFGGRDCCATVHIAASVPLGPADARAVPPRGPPGGRLPEAEPFEDDDERPPGDLDDEVRAYIQRYTIDDSAATALLDLGPDDQRRVIDADLVNCRNPSAVLLSRVRACQSGRFSDNNDGRFNVVRDEAAKALTNSSTSHRERPRSRSRSPHRGGELMLFDRPADMTVDEYIEKHQLDDAASEALRGLPPDLQKEVLQIELHNCRNTSAVFMSRLRSLENGINPAKREHRDRDGGREQRSSWDHQSPRASSSFSLPSSVYQQSQAQIQGGHSFPQMSQVRSARVEEFIMRHNIDESSAQQLRELPQSAQRTICEVELSNCRNPSAIVAARIQAARSEGGGHGGGGGFSSNIGEAVEEYIQRHSLDDKVSNDLRALSPEAQRYVVDTDLSSARNPSAVIASRIRDFRGKFPSGL